MLKTIPGTRAIVFVLGSVLVMALAAADDPKKPASQPSSPPDGALKATHESGEINAALGESWPDHPEWLDMLVAILDDEPMSASFGWFRTAVSQTRFDWSATSKRYDRDGDRKIVRKEFPGDDASFARLDRNRDSALTAADFDFAGSALAPSPGAMLYARLDRDANGKVTREELEAFFKSIDRDGLGFLSQSDLLEAFAMPSSRSAMRQGSGSGMPSKATLVRGLFHQEIGSLQPGPKLDESAPDFMLKTNDGKSEVSLSKLAGPKPVVLIFGSFTCGPFRSHSGNLEKLYRRYKDRATFVMVYVREAHPTDGWRMESNDRVGAITAQPKSYDERVSVAQKCGKVLDLGFPMLVDTIDDAVGARYSGMPGRLYLVDRDGKVAFKSGRGPYLFKPAELEQSLILLLEEDAASRSNAPRAALPAGSAAPSESLGQRGSSSSR
jgi:thiol-disulfide isomerase/thioredoxin